MAKVRVYELAKELGVESKTIMTKLTELGEFVRSASSTIEPPVVRKLRDAFPAQQQDGAAKPAASKPSGPRPGKPAPAAPAPSAPAEQAPAAAAPAAPSAPVPAPAPTPAPAPVPATPDAPM